MFSLKNKFDKVPENQIEHKEQQQPIDIDKGKNKDRAAHWQGKGSLEQDALQNSKQGDKSATEDYDVADEPFFALSLLWC